MMEIVIIDRVKESPSKKVCETPIIPTTIAIIVEGGTIISINVASCAPDTGFLCLVNTIMGSVRMPFLTV